MQCYKYRNLIIIDSIRKGKEGLKEIHIKMCNPMAEPKKYALITGASMGFGKELAEELARRKTNLLLVSLPGEGLEDICTPRTALTQESCKNCCKRSFA